MMKSILAATDLSGRSTPAIARAVQLARGTGAALCILHVVEGDLPDERTQEETLSAEAAIKNQAAAHGAPDGCEIAVETGHAFHVIGEAARVRDADLIVMGVHRRQFLRDVFVGTTIERVTRTAGRPVLMASSSTAYPWRKIFIATDLSETSGQAARMASALGLLGGAEVTFLHAYAPITRQMMNFAGVPADRVYKEADREFQTTRRKLGHFIEGLELGDLDYDARIVEGLGAEAIAGAVEQAKPDLLVIGSRGLSGVKRLFLGSVAQELMGSVAVDVLAVPPQG